MLKNGRRRLWRRIVATVAVLATVFSANSAQALTLNGADFARGSIITDNQFFDSNSMTAEEIQAFLDYKIVNCVSTKDLCLNVYTQDTSDREATKIHNTSGNALCDAYKGEEDETAAEIIYKVQEACHISAKTILVTLQKEQGLITNRNPTADKLKIAMGYACPDTAPCSTQYYGFFNQVYSAASQLKRYTDPTSAFYASKPVGSVSQIYYHPKASCGTKAVKILNAATHALYLYTPYTPNAAALANLTGLGDSCSSYGNSNFWEYFQYWFNTDANLKEGVAALDDDVLAELGTRSDSKSCSETANSCTFEYTGGYASWSILGDTLYTTGAIAQGYRDAGGPGGKLGAIYRAEKIAYAGSRGQGLVQRFVNGYIYETNESETYYVLNQVAEYYLSVGGPAGDLGWPLENSKCASSGCQQKFDGGYLISDAEGSFKILTGDIADSVADENGVKGPWGLPTAEAVDVDGGDYGTGRSQAFENGIVYEYNGESYLVTPTMQTFLTKAGGIKSLGWPLEEQVVLKGVTSQLFSAGRFVIVDSKKAVLIRESSLQAFNKSGGFSGYLGKPSAAATTVKTKAGETGYQQLFTGGAIITTPIKSYAIPSAVWKLYLKAGGVAKLGWPTTKAKQVSGKWTMTFGTKTLKG